MKTSYSRASERGRSIPSPGRHRAIESALDGPLDDRIARGFVAMTVDRFYDGGSCAVVLWHADDSGLEISAKQSVDVACVATDDGVLCVAAALVSRPPDAQPLPSDFADRVHATSLVRLARGRTVACGIVLTGRTGSRIALVVGAWPYALEIEAAFAAGGTVS